MIHRSGFGDLVRPLGDRASEQLYLYYRTAALAQRAVAGLRRHGWMSVEALDDFGTDEEPWVVVGVRPVRPLHKRWTVMDLAVQADAC